MTSGHSSEKGMMGVYTRDRHRGLAAVLLLAVQLCAVILAPALHSDPPAADHIEAPGTHPPGHSEAACLMCRHAEGRFIHTLVPRPLTLAGPIGGVDAAPTRSFVFVAPLTTTRAARAPPAA
jgi:hypothetical protein